jgi:hypothetical protein
MKTIVNAPAVKAHQFGLVNQANVITGDGERWENGVTFTPLGCDVVHAHDARCWVAGSAEKGVQGCKAPVEFWSFVLELGIVWPAAENGYPMEEHVVESLEVGTSAVLERLQQWNVEDVPNGTDIVTPPVAGAITAGGIVGRALGTNANAMLSGGLPLATTGNSREMIGLMEAKFLDASDHIGAAGTLYMSPVVAAGGWDMFTVNDDGKLVTKMTGSTVVVGNYEPGFVYGHTGEVDLYLSNVFTNIAPDHTNNEILILAERVAVIAWNPCAMFVGTVV